MKTNRIDIILRVAVLASAVFMGLYAYTTRIQAPTSNQYFAF
jgi:hypothetical protein